MSGPSSAVRARRARRGGCAGPRPPSPFAGGARRGRRGPGPRAGRHGRAGGGAAAAGGAATGSGPAPSVAGRAAPVCMSQARGARGRRRGVDRVSLATGARSLGSGRAAHPGRDLLSTIALVPGRPASPPRSRCRGAGLPGASETQDWDVAEGKGSSKPFEPVFTGSREPEVGVEMGWV